MPNLAMTDDLYNELQYLFSELDDGIRSDFNTSEKGFVEDLNDKFVRFDRDLFISEGQMEWLRRIAKKYEVNPFAPCGRD